jgi:acyl transferase domain-containing protein/acyl carrier protein
MTTNSTRNGLEIAVIGMSGVFPGATSIQQFWDNLLAGHSTISRLTDAELAAAGVHPAVLEQPNFVNAKGVFPDLEYFDAGFFDYTPRDAAVMDPQVRALHQCVYHALEDAGYAAQDQKGSIGLFAGSSGNFAWELSTLLAAREGSASQLATIQLNDKDFVSTRIAYKLNLRGPCVTLHCACSTSLYAVDMACRQLLTGACSVAVAAGSGLTLPHKNGYLYETGMIKSADGACRPFSDDANGTVEGNGMGAVVLKPLEAALRDRDRIYAVIRGTSANNDGARKVGFTAPSVEGQAEVVRRALHMADVDPSTISYVEAHGTGTALGDPVEIEGLKKAFNTERSGFCGIGSLKSNIGHLDAAAGISSLIKVTLALKHRQIPASIHFRAPNPGIDFEHSPFYVVDQSTEWTNPAAHPRRAGVSSFGIGGTNVHLIMEEAPLQSPSTPGRDWNVLCLSALDAAALGRLEQAVAQQVAEEVDLDPSDLAYSFQLGRRKLPARAALVYRDMADLFRQLGEGAAGAARQLGAASQARVAFLFSGQGTQYPGMGLGLYRSEPVFREELERCMALCDALGQTAVRAQLMNAAPAPADVALMNRTDVAQPALFAVEYATARLFIDWGIAPAAMIGHSLGEYVAACVAGVMTLEQALALVVARGRLMADVAPGAMLAVAASEDEVRASLPAGIDLAAANGPAQCTVSGPAPLIEAYAALLAERGIAARPLHTSHAFHSGMMEAVLAPLRDCFAGIALAAPTIPYVSNLTGAWITAEEAQDPDYYARHLRQTVRFADGAGVLLQDSGMVYLEIGPGAVLGSFLKQQAGGAAVAAALRHASSGADDAQQAARALGELWTRGAAPDWKRYHRHATRSRVETPAYPFEKQRFAIGEADIYRLLEGKSAPRPPAPGNGQAGGGTMVPGWQSALLPCTDEAFTVRACLAVVEQRSWLPALARVGGLRLSHAAHQRRYQAQGAGSFGLDLDRVADYRRLIQALKVADGVPNCLVWLAASGAQKPFAQLAERIGKLALALRSECPGEQFKCVLVMASGQRGAPDDAEVEAFVRGVRASCGHFELRCVYIDPRLDAAAGAALMEREIYDADSATLLAAYEQGRRQVYRPLAAPCAVAPAGALGGKTLGVLAPAAFPGAELAARLADVSGARVIALAYAAPPQRLAAAIPVDSAALRAHLFASGQHQLRWEAGDVRPSHALMDEACTALVAACIDGALGLRPGVQFSRSELKRSLRAADRFDKYIDYFIAMLCEDGVIAPDGDGYRVLRGIDALRPVGDIKAAMAAHGALFTGQLALLEHCVAAFPGALSGDIAAIEVLYPEGKNELLQRSYAGSIQELEDNQIRAVLENLVRQIVACAGQRPIRILEGGGGYGLMMRRIVPLLRGLDVEYYFTDIGKTFLADARQFALDQGYDFLTFGTFDLTRDPVEQGLEAKSFDLVLAFNVVHATRSLSATVANLQLLLKDGGWMCLLERTKVRRYVDLVWGLADGWWHFDDSERKLSPLLGLDGWEAIARAAGFADVLAYPEDPAMRRQIDVGVLLARTAVPAQEEAMEASDDALRPWTVAAVPPGVVLDGLIVLEDRLDRAADAFEPIGDGLARARRAQDGYLTALLPWIARQKPGFVSVWSAGDALQNLPDQIERARAAQRFDEGGRALLGAAAWSRLSLPTAFGEADGGALLREAMRAVQGGLALAVIDPQHQSLFNPARPAPAAPRAEPASQSAIDGADDYALLLHGLWSELFGIERIGAHEDFFELGGDSLKVAQLTTELEKRGIKLLSNEVFNRPTIAGLAAYLQETRHNDSGQIRDADALLGHLRTQLGIEAAWETLAHDGKPCQVLYLADHAFEQEVAPDALLRDLRLPAALEPHRVLPLSRLRAGGVESPASAAVWAGLGLREAGGEGDLAAAIVGAQSDLRRLSDQVCAGAVTGTYPLSPFQKMYLKGATRFSFYLIDFDEPIDVAILNRALTDIVGLQGLMRSHLRRNLWGKPFWDEHAAPAADLQVPVVDLSGAAPAHQGALLEALMESEYQADFDSAEGIMYRLMLIRLDRRRHTLLFNLDHSIFDNMSGQVLRRQLLNRYRALAAGSNAPMEAVKSFRDYLDQLNRGPQGVDKARLIDLFDLVRYRQAKLAVERRIVARRQPAIGKLKFELDLDAYRLSDDDEAAWEMTLVLLCCVLGRFLEQDAIPLKIVYQGRKYQDLSYFDTLGLFVDVLPLLVMVDRDDPAGMIESIKRKIRFVNRYNVSFMNMLLNLRMRLRWWDVLAPVGPKKLPQRDPMILLNYAGKAEREYQKVIDFATRQMEKSGKKLDYASFYSIVTVVDRKIVFDIFCSFEHDMGALRSLFEEEAARLLPAAEPAIAVAALTAPALDLNLDLAQ